VRSETILFLTALFSLQGFTKKILFKKTPFEKKLFILNNLYFVNNFDKKFTT